MPEASYLACDKSLCLRLSRPWNRPIGFYHPSDIITDRTPQVYLRVPQSFECNGMGSVLFNLPSVRRLEVLEWIVNRFRGGSPGVLLVSSHHTGPRVHLPLARRKPGPVAGLPWSRSRSNIGGQHFSDELLIRSRHSIPQKGGGKRNILGRAFSPTALTNFICLSSSGSSARNRYYGPPFAVLHIRQPSRQPPQCPNAH